MATETDATNGCTLRWRIRNINHCWLKTGEYIESPACTVESLECTEWSLRLYPKGEYTENRMDVYLHRRDSSHPCFINVNFYLAIADKNGKSLAESSVSNENISREHYSMGKYFEAEKIFITEREAFLPEDTLTIQCAFWKGEEQQPNTKCHSVQTVYKVNHRSFKWKINKFITLIPGPLTKFKDDLIRFDVVLIQGLDIEKRIVIDGAFLDQRIKYFSFKTSIIDSKGQKEDCGKHEYFSCDLKKELLFTLLFTKNIIENKSRYLPDDILSLDFEFSYSSGAVSYELSSSGIISPEFKKAAIEKRKGRFEEQSNMQLTPALANDLKSMHDEGAFCDVELRTVTRTFPAHKFILISRSPVFRKMFSSDMKEKNSGYVDITDLEDDIVHRMLQYMYTDTLEDLQLDTACNLYAAAEKYEIMSLKNRCSSFLMDNLCPSKVCDILLLADQHQDKGLKSAVQDFILQYDKEVFGSQEWKDFMASSIQLASDIMYRKVFPC